MKYLVLFLMNIFFFTNTLYCQWTKTNGPIYPSGSHTRYLVSYDTNVFACTMGGGMHLSTDNGINWKPINNGLTNNKIWCLFRKKTDLFIGTDGSGVYRSTDNGLSWFAANNGLTEIASYVRTIIEFDSNLYVGTYAGVFVSSNNGETWGQLAAANFSKNVFALVSRDSVLFAGTQSGIYHSTNNGNDWIQSSALPDKFVTCLALKDKAIIAGTDSGIYISSDNGKNWNAVNSGLLKADVYSIAVERTNIFVAIPKGGVYVLTNNSQAWKLVNDGLPNNWPMSLAVDSVYLLAGSYPDNFGSGGFVWRRSLSEMVTIINDNAAMMPTQSILHQNYPNPFNPTTNISFSLASKEFVTLKIFDLTGREVTQLVSEELSAGNYDRKWVANNNASGIYFYQLTAGNFVETKKLLLLK